MIFVTLGSQKFQFNRLLKELDKIVGANGIEDEIFAQTGYSDYKPKNYKFKDFVDRDEFKELMENANIVISHGGTGAIITAVKQGKKVIAIPRLAKYGEHVDDHQIQLIDEFKELNLIETIYRERDLKSAIYRIKNKTFNKYISNTETIISDIEKYIESSVNNEKNQGVLC